MNRIQVNLQAFPAHVLEAVCRPNAAENKRSPESVINPLVFPKSKMHLWDPTPNGDLTNLHLSFHRKPRLLLMEKALRLAHRHARQSKKPRFSCFLVGTLAVDGDEEGVTITLDRFDPGREQPGGTKAPTALLPGDVLVPCSFDVRRVTDGTVYSADDFDTSIKMLKHGCCSRETLELCKLVSLRARLSCVENMDQLSFGLHWAGVSLASSLEAVPVRALPIIPTALARNLSSPASMAQPLHSRTAGRKRGFLTMDQTRKLLLVLESDPKVYTLPLVGVWLSGVTHIYNPVVWAWCLRYLYSSSLHDRVMAVNESFLVVLYSLAHRDPEFYQCKPHGPKDLSFQLLVSTESLTLYKNVEPADGRSLQFELSAGNQGQEAELFKEALSRLTLSRAGAVSSSSAAQNKVSISDHDSGVEDEDLSPRPSPNPHPISQQVRQVQPSVPELSMVLDGSFLDGKVVESHVPLSHPAQSNPQHRSSGGSQSATSAPRAHSVMAGPPPIRRPLTPVLSQPKLNRAQPTIGHPTPKLLMGRKSVPSTSRRSSNGSSTSSSSSSSPRTACSPNDSLHQHTPRSGSTHSPHSHPPAAPPASNPKCKKVSSEQVPTPHPPQHTVFHSTPAFTPCSCCPAHHGHMPVYHGNTWQMPVHMPSTNHVHCPSESPSHADCYLSPARPGMPQSSHISPAQSPVYHPSANMRCSPLRVPTASPTAGDQAAPTCQAQCCQFQPDCAVTTPQASMGLLPADAYRMLMEQDRQLKQLQAQIHKLLSAQSKEPEPLRASTAEQQEQAIQTSANSEPQKRRGVSIAVGTGASLFWNEPDQIAIHEGPAVECHPENECTVFPGLGQEEENPEAPRHSTSPHHQHHNAPSEVALPSLSSPVLGESASMYCCSQSNDCSENGETQDQRFYHDLLGQVKSRLQDSVVEEEKMESDAHGRDHRLRQSQSPRNSPPNRPAPAGKTRKHRAGLSDEDQVYSATLKQLQQLGVNVELDTGKTIRATVESASTLACINPEAVVPRLALSESTGTSVWGLSGGVDLSLEANAIALKYLSDSQLSRLSLGGQTPGVRPNPGAVLFGKTPLDRSSVGLSVLSSSNMSLATHSYMKKYGLIEGGGSSSGEEEEDGSEEEEEEEQHVQTDSALGHSLQHDRSETDDAARNGGPAFILKNITNKPPEPSPPLRSSKPSQDSQSQLIRDLRPKLQLLTQGPGKENMPKVQHQPRSSLSDNQRLLSVPENQGSVGNFLDLSRLRQLPKLF